MQIYGVKPFSDDGEIRYPKPEFRALEVPWRNGLKACWQRIFFFSSFLPNFGKIECISKHWKSSNIPKIWATIEEKPRPICLKPIFQLVPCTLKHILDSSLFSIFSALIFLMARVNIYFWNFNFSIRYK